jgi:hypothetical protein
MTPMNTTRQNGSAHPRIVVSASAISSSSSGAVEAITADSPMTTAASARNTESIVRLLRRPGSLSVSRAMPQGRALESADSAFVRPAVVRALPTLPTSARRSKSNEGSRATT